MKSSRVSFVPPRLANPRLGGETIRNAQARGSVRGSTALPNVAGTPSRPGRFSCVHNPSLSQPAYTQAARAGDFLHST
jgi:hypothetical protein